MDKQPQSQPEESAFSGAGEINKMQHFIGALDGTVTKEALFQGEPVAKTVEPEKEFDTESIERWFESYFRIAPEPVIVAARNGDIDKHRLDKSAGDLESGQAIPIYEPFDPVAELARIRQLDPKDQELPITMQRELIRRRLESYGKTLEYQRFGIASLVDEWTMSIVQHPDIDREHYDSMINKFAAVYRFSDDQIHSFGEALNKYEWKHAAIGKYREKYPENNDLFTACIGESPLGKVDVVIGPMTIMFRCWDERDFALINVGARDQDAVEESNKCIGVAINSCNIDALKGAITAENGAHMKRKTEKILVPLKSGEITNETGYFWLDGLEHLRVQTVDGEAWNVNCRTYDDSTFVSIEGPADEAPDVVAYMYTNGDNVHMLSHTLPVGSEPARSTARVFNLGKPGNNFDIVVTPTALKVQNANSVPITFVTGNMRTSKLNELAGDTTDFTQIHEDRHQLNKLFVPVDPRVSLDCIVQASVERGDPAAATADQIALTMIRNQRRSVGMDRAARDEILAYYSEFKEPGSIAAILGDSLGYDYYHDYSDYESMINMPEYIREKLGDYDVEFETKYSRNSNSTDQVDDHIKHLMDQVFITEYRRDLDRWTGALMAMERKGHTHGEIMARFTTAPVSEWTQIARRAASV